MQPGILDISAHVTQRAASISGSGISAAEKKSFDGESKNLDATTTSEFDGRPDLKEILREATSTPGESVGIVVCGPETMCFDVKEAAAEAQRRVLSGTGPNEVYLHTEAF